MAELPIGIKDKTGRGMRGVLNSFRRIRREARKTTKSSNNLVSSLMNMGGPHMRAISGRMMGRAGIVGGFAAVGAIMAKLSKEYMEFATAMAEVSTLLPKASKEVEILADETKRLAVQFGSMPVAQTKAVYQIISAGASDAASAIATLDAANSWPCR